MSTLIFIIIVLYLFGSINFGTVFSTAGIAIAAFVALCLAVTLSRRSSAHKREAYDAQLLDAKQTAEARRREQERLMAQHIRDEALAEERARQRAAQASEPAQVPSPAQTPAPEVAPAPEADVVEFPGKIGQFVPAYHYEDVDLCTLDETIFDVPDFAPGAALTLKHEPENEHDPHDVALFLDGRKVGYLYRGKLQDMANDWLATRRPVLAILTAVDDDAKKARIALAFYDVTRFKKLLRLHPNARTYRLTGNANAEMQENIELCSRGDLCDLDYDFDKEKYLVSAGVDIGYLPASAARLVEDAGEDACEVFVASTGTSDSGRAVVEVYVFVDDKGTASKI